MNEFVCNLAIPTISNRVSKQSLLLAQNLTKLSRTFLSHLDVDASTFFGGLGALGLSFLNLVELLIAAGGGGAGAFPDFLNGAAFFSINSFCGYSPKKTL